MTLKVHYRKRLMRHIVVEMDKARMVTDVLDAIGWLHLAWACVMESTIVKCFAKCGFSSDTCDDLPKDADALQQVGLVG